MKPPATLCPGPLSRRHFLKIGCLALGGFALNGLLPLRVAAKDGDHTGPDTSVILIWLPGGPPHMETYDLKPDAPAEYRGSFKPIRTNVPGIDVCELLPMHAKVAERFVLVRSICHAFSDHGGGHKRFLTGRDPLSPVGFINDHPAVGSMVAKVRQDRQAGVPNYVVGADDGRTGIDVFSFGSAYLGPSTHPFTVGGDPSSPKFEVKNLAPAPAVADRMPDRLALLQGLDQKRPGLDPTGTMDAVDTFQQRVLRLLTTDAARKAFDLSREPAALRERYGMHPWGQRALMARRLVEAGASFVTMVMENPTPPGGAMPAGVTYNWDLHAVNGHIFDDAKFRLPFYDRAVTALIEDLYTRGLDKKVMLIVTGEFGRTPRISYAEGRPGRDHWPQAMSLLVSGGGFKTGQVIGSTDAKGEHPKDRPLTPNDLWATMFKHLGIDYSGTTFPDHQGRPMAILPYGEPITELG
jgi:uncharacterized protein (DUF1501 family)